MRYAYTLTGRSIKPLLSLKKLTVNESYNVNYRNRVHQTIEVPQHATIAINFCLGGILYLIVSSWKQNCLAFKFDAWVRGS